MQTINDDIENAQPPVSIARPSVRLENQNPRLVPLVCGLLGQRGQQEAESRRKDDRASSVGVTLSEIADEAEKHGISISKSSIHTLCMGPRKNNK